METTTNLGLKKPDLSDAAAVSVFNENSDKIDAAVGALESKTSIKTGTLAAGATSITINDSKITSSSILTFFTSVFGVNPESVTVSTGSVTLTFEAQSSSMEVGVRVDG